MSQLSITEFIQKTLSEIKEALPQGYSIDEAVDFEISVTTVKKSGGGVDLKVASGKISNDKEIIQKISFSIIDANQRDKDFKKSGDILIKHVTKGIKQLAKVDKQIKAQNEKK